MNCNTWQFNTDSATTPPTTSCMIGVGEHCYRAATPGATITVTAAQRIQRGSVRVLANMAGKQVLNIHNMGPFQADETPAEGAQRCETWCNANLFCSYWSYAADGCSVETQALAASYPLTTATGVAENNDYTAGMVGAEYIEHYCPETTTTTTTVAAATTAAATTTVAANVVATTAPPTTAL